jgi:hypothetical protein
MSPEQFPFLQGALHPVVVQGSGGEENQIPWGGDQLAAGIAESPLAGDAVDDEPIAGAAGAIGRVAAAFDEMAGH